MDYRSARRRHGGAISTEYVIAIVVIAVACILGFMYLAFTSRSQSKSVVTKISGKVVTTERVQMAVTDPLVEQKNSMDQSGSTEGELEFDAGGGRKQSTSVASAGRGTSRSGASNQSGGSARGSASSSAGGRGGAQQNPQGGSGGGDGASAGNSAAGGGQQAVAGSSGFIRKGGSGGSAAPAERKVSSSGATSAKPDQGIPLIWLLVGLVVVFTVFFAVMYIGRGS
ncbi:hypothetical protein IT570_14660 [Candidatus Sumerlaeota bacterium]|nr:hypothetical protein [Candidatus Sumerlaeota bacterium]